MCLKGIASLPPSRTIPVANNWELSHRLQLRGQWRHHTAFPYTPLEVQRLPARFMHRRNTRHTC